MTAPLFPQLMRHLRWRGITARFDKLTIAYCAAVVPHAVII